MTKELKQSLAFVMAIILILLWGFYLSPYFNDIKFDKSAYNIRDTYSYDDLLKENAVLWREIIKLQGEKEQLSSMLNERNFALNKKLSGR